MAHEASTGGVVVLDRNGERVVFSEADRALVADDGRLDVISGDGTVAAFAAVFWSAWWLNSAPKHVLAK